MCRELTPLDGLKLGLPLSVSTTSAQSVAQTDMLSQRQHCGPTQEAAKRRAEQQLAAAREGSAAFAAASDSRVHQPASQWQSPTTSSQWAPSTASRLSLGALAQLQVSTKQAGWASSMPSVPTRPSSQPAAHRASKHADEAPEHPAQELPSWEQSESGSRVKQVGQQICIQEGPRCTGPSRALAVAAPGALLATLCGCFRGSNLWPPACCTHDAVMASWGLKPSTPVWHCRCSQRPLGFFTMHTPNYTLVGFRPHSHPYFCRSSP